MRHPLTMEFPPRWRPGLLRANLEHTCQDRVMVTRFGRVGRGRRPGYSTGKRQRGLISTIGPCEGGRIFHALLAVQDTGGQPTRSPDCPLKEAEPEPTSYSTARSSIDSGVWTEAMQAEFVGLEAAETFVEISGVPAGSNTVESK